MVRSDIILGRISKSKEVTRKSLWEKCKQAGATTSYYDTFCKHLISGKLTCDEAYVISKELKFDNPSSVFFADESPVA